jgi:hypothetical protein
MIAGDIGLMRIARDGTWFYLGTQPPISPQSCEKTAIVTSYCAC